MQKALRSSVRGSGQKVRPSILKTKGQSPHVAVETNYPVTQPSLMTGEKPSGQQKSSPSRVITSTVSQFLSKC